MLMHNRMWRVSTQNYRRRLGWGKKMNLEQMIAFQAKIRPLEPNESFAGRQAYIEHIRRGEAMIEPYLLALPDTSAPNTLHIRRTLPAQST
jgi:hypothetical protein